VWTDGVSGTSVRILTVPICPDLLRYDQLGVADNFRGKIIRGFFWLMQIWREK